MITLVLAQIATRWGQALTLLVLSIAATAAAVSAPAFTVAIGRAAVDNGLAAADSSERVVSLPPLPVGTSDSSTSTDSSTELDAYAKARSELAGFLPVTTAQISVQGLGSDKGSPHTRRLLGRDGLCAHATFVRGRCPVGSREAALPSRLARETGAGPGDEVVLTPVKRDREAWVPDGPPTPVTLVGVFEARDRSDPYWAPEDPFGRHGFTPAIVTNRTALRTLPHGQETDYLDAILPAGLLTPDRIPTIRRQLDAVEHRLAQQDQAVTGVTSGVPRLLDRITHDRDQARALLPIAAAPLVALCWFVVYLAVGHGVSGRRHEVAMVALHGAKRRTRAAAFGGESLLPVLAGVPLGLVIARAVVALAGPGAGGETVPIDRAQLLAAALAAAGTVAAAILALRRELAAPVVQLLRQVPPRRLRTVAAAAEVLAIALGVVVAVDLRVLGGRLVGVMVAAPVLIMLAVAVLAVLVFRPLVDLAGRRSLVRGRIAPAMAALYLARRPGSARLLVVLALVLGTLGFAFTSAQVAAEGRGVEARRSLGASRVLEVQPVDRTELLKSVRAADPTGRYAMAAMSTPQNGEGPPVLAVDATRLARVALWSDRYGGPGPAKVAALLRPPAPKPITVGNGELAAKLSHDPLTRDGTLSVSLQLVPAAGDPEVATFGPVTEGKPTYETMVSGCADGCRLAAITVSTTDDAASRIGVTVHELRQGGTDVLSPGWLSDPDRWRNPERGPVTERLWPEARADGLLLTQHDAEPDTDYQVLPVDVPYPLPVVTAGKVPGKLLTNIDGNPVGFTARARLDGLPGVGATGVLMDLGYAERLTSEPGIAWEPQVWLATDAPPGLPDRLRDQGLVITGDRTVDGVRESIDRSGAAMALGFYRLSAVIAVLVGLGALALVIAVDRRTWGAGLNALRTQGLAERTATAAAIWSYGGIVLAGAAAGALAAGAAWFAAGGRIPLGVDASMLTTWPPWIPVLAPWILIVIGVFGAAVVGARWQRRRTRGVQEVGG